MGHEQAQLVGRPTSGRRRSGRRGRPRPARSPARPTRRCRRGAAGGRAAARTPAGRGVAAPPRRRPDAAGTPSGGSSGNDSTSVGPVLPRCVGVEPGQLGVVGQDQPDRGRRRRAGRRRAPRAIARASARHRRPATATPSRTVEVDPPRRDVDRPGHDAPRAGSPPPPPAARRDSSSTTLFCGYAIRVWYMPEQLRRRTPRGSARGRAASGRTRRTGRRRCRSSMIRATIARIAGSSRDASERTDASTPSASMISAASRDCGFGPAWRNRRSSTAPRPWRPRRSQAAERLGRRSFARA